MNCLNILNYGNKVLKSNDIDSHSLDTELLLAKVLNKTREELLTNLNEDVDKNKLNKFNKLLIRRKQKEPMAYIFSRKEFWRYNFIVNRDVLIPRPETEIIIEEVLKLIKPNSSKYILDVGTGTGCIILSLIKERPKSRAIALDLSKKAIKTAVSNAKLHHIQNKIKFINIDVDKFNYNKYDFILSNPPYINNINFKRLEENVRKFEPKLALNAGIDGLKVIRKLILKSKKLLKKNGKLIFEIGENQKDLCIDLLLKNGFYVNKICKDLCSTPRVIISTNNFNE
tara:strand:+ start:315 stop:1166 length:852 start_codon:yes stop_codon:yes gene_type:complete